MCIRDRILLGDVFIRGGSSSGTHVLEEGRPIGQFYGLVCNGIDENGRYIMVDKDGDGEISDPADYDYIGSAQPKLTYGITNTFRYKNFDLSFFLRGTIGNDILNATRMAYAQSGVLPGDVYKRQTYISRHSPTLADSRFSEGLSLHCH